MGFLKAIFFFSILSVPLLSYAADFDPEILSSLSETISDNVLMKQEQLEDPDNRVAPGNKMGPASPELYFSEEKTWEQNQVALEKDYRRRLIKRQQDLLKKDFGATDSDFIHGIPVFWDKNGQCKAIIHGQEKMLNEHQKQVLFPDFDYEYDPRYEYSLRRSKWSADIIKTIPDVLVGFTPLSLPYGLSKTIYHMHEYENFDRLPEDVVDLVPGYSLGKMSWMLSIGNARLKNVTFEPWLSEVENKNRRIHAGLDKLARYYGGGCRYAAGTYYRPEKEWFNKTFSEVVSDYVEYRSLLQARALNELEVEKPFDMYIAKTAGMLNVPLSHLDKVIIEHRNRLKAESMFRRIKHPGFDKRLLKSRYSHMNNDLGAGFSSIASRTSLNNSSLGAKSNFNDLKTYKMKNFSSSGAISAFSGVSLSKSKQHFTDDHVGISHKLSKVNFYDFYNLPKFSPLRNDFIQYTPSGVNLGYIGAKGRSSFGSAGASLGTAGLHSFRK